MRGCEVGHGVCGLGESGLGCCRGGEDYCLGADGVVGFDGAESVSMSGG